jgi:hypothetical protein
LQFTLPETNLRFDMEAEIIWADVKGRAGLRFVNVSKTSQERLEEWLDNRLEEELPGAKERIASDSEPLQ